MVLSLLVLVTSSSMPQAQAKHRRVKRGDVKHSVVQSTLIEAAKETAQLWQHVPTRNTCMSVDAQAAAGTASDTSWPGSRVPVGYAAR